MGETNWEEGARQERRPPICPACGVTAMPSSVVRATEVFVCDNADCEAFGERV